MICPICEQAIGKKPVVFQQQYFPRLQQDQAICKKCHSALSEQDIYNKLAPLDDQKEIDYATLHTNKLKRTYSNRRTLAFVFLAIGVITMAAQMLSPRYNPSYLIPSQIFNIWFWISIGLFVSASRVQKRLDKIEVMTPEEREDLESKESPAHCAVCDATQDFPVSSLVPGAHFPDGVLLLKQFYPDLPHNMFVCEKCRKEHPSTKAIYTHLIQDKTPAEKTEEDVKLTEPTKEKEDSQEPEKAREDYDWAMGRLSSGDNEEALAALKVVVRLHPEYPEAHCGLGIAYEKVEQNEEAAKAFKEAIRLNPDLAEAHSGLGQAYLKLGRNEDALEAAKDAIRLNPDSTIAHVNLGKIFNSLGRYEDAIQTFKYAIRLEPYNVDAHYGLGLTYIEFGNHGGALDEYKVLKDLDEKKANQLFDVIYE